jgi:hypothetical protein
LALVLVGLCLSTAGCGLPNTAPVDMTAYETVDLGIFVGAVYDHRTQVVGDDEDAPLARGEVRLPASEIRSKLADSLGKSELFRAVVNPPAQFAGDTPDAMLAHAQQSSDYLLVAEVNQLHLKSLGFNWRASVSVPCDLIFAPISLVLYAMTAGNHMVFTGGFMGCWTAEVVFSISVSLIDANTGTTALTLRIEERAHTAHDAREAFGVMWDEDDDWLDLGRRLAEIAVHNAGVRLAEKLNEQLPTLTGAPRPAPPQAQEPEPAKADQ